LILIPGRGLPSLLESHPDRNDQIEATTAYRLPLTATSPNRPRIRWCSSPAVLWRACRRVSSGVDPLRLRQSPGLRHPAFQRSIRCARCQPTPPLLSRSLQAQERPVLPSSSSRFPRFPEILPGSTFPDSPSQSPNFLIKRALEQEAGGMYLTLRWSAIHRRSRFTQVWNRRRQARQTPGPRRATRARLWSRADPRCAGRRASPARARGRAP
jgi:hypothetical protein